MAKPHTKDQIVLEALMAAPHAGWSDTALREAAIALGQNALMADAMFAEGTRSATKQTFDIFDRMMADALSNIDITNLRVRDRIAKAVMTRLTLMAPYRDGLSVVLASIARPARAFYAAKSLWRSADIIWDWAGDTATDYNRYTKRALLSGVMASTLFFWLQDRSPKFTATQAFLDRRIENVLLIGRALSGIKKKAA